MSRTKATTRAAKRSAIYCRKSTSKGLEQDFNSIDAQREACEQYVASQPGWDAIDVRYDDGGFTGANLDRPSFRSLMADVEAGEVDVIVCYKLDRLSRSLSDFVGLMATLRDADVAFVSVTQNFSTDNALGRMTLNLLATFAEFEREMTAERTRDKIGAARRRGQWTGGRVPVGYDNVDRRLVVNEYEAGIVREVFALYQRLHSAVRVARALNDAGHSTKRRVSPNGRESGGKHVLTALRNPIYAGLIRAGGDVVEGEHDAIIDPDEFERVQRLLEGKGREPSQRYRNPDYLLTGLLRCGCCEGAFTPASTTKGDRLYRYYRCSTRDKRGRDACPSKQLPAAAIEDFVIDRIRDATADGALAEDVLAETAARLDAERTRLAAEKKRLPREIAACATEGRKLAKKLAATSSNAQKFLDESLAEVGRQLDAKERRLAEVDARIDAIDAARVDAEWVSRALRDFDRLWEVMTPENRRRLVQTIVANVVVNKTEGTIEATLADIGAPGDAVAPQEQAA